MHRRHCVKACGSRGLITNESDMKVSWHLLLIASIVTTSKALVTSSVALVTNSFLLLIANIVTTSKALVTSSDALVSKQRKP